MEPGQKHYVVVDAPCEATAIDRLHAKGWRNWSTLYLHERYVRRLNLIKWSEI